MRLYSVRLVAAVSLFACVEASALELQPEPTLPETSGHGHTSDQTFPQNGAITVDEERMPRLNVIEAARAIAIKLQKSQFADWALKCEKKLGLTSLKPLNPELKSDDLFRNPPSNAWDKLVDAGDLVNIEHKMLLRMLLARYNEFDLAKAFHAAMEIDELISTAECLQLQLNWRWEATKPPYEELFVKLGLDPTNEDFIGSHLFRTWYDVVAVEVLRNDSTVVEFLKAHLDDFGLAKALEAAKKADSAKHIVDNLENAFIDEWRYDHPHEVFDKLGLKATSDDLLGIPLFKLWYKFAMQNQWSTEEVVKILLTRSDNFSFAKMLDGAKKVDSTSALAIELEKAYIRMWKGKHPDRLFDKLGLKATSDDLLGIPLFKTWYNFATQKWSTLDVVKFLESRSDEFSVAKMLEGATKAEDTKKIAFELQAAQFGHWSSSRVSESTVRKHMGLGFFTVFFETLGLPQNSVDPIGYGVWKKYREWRQKPLIKRKRQGLHARFDDSNLDK